MTKSLKNLRESAVLAMRTALLKTMQKKINDTPELKAKLDAQRDRKRENAKKAITTAGRVGPALAGAAIGSLAGPSGVLGGMAARYSAGKYAFGEETEIALTPWRKSLLRHGEAYIRDGVFVHKLSDGRVRTTRKKGHTVVNALHKNEATALTHIEGLKAIKEEASVNNVGGGAIPGMGKYPNDKPANLSISICGANSG